jgi:heat-inducible transcriptional repressor
LIAQPHTSAGRVPTDKGYRLFVDRLAQVKPLTAAERRAVQAFLDGAVDLDDVLRRSVRLLAQLTRQVAVVQYPSLARSSVRHVELVPIDGSRLLVVLITTTGRVEQRIIDVGTDLLTGDGESTLSTVRAELNRATSGRTLGEAAAELAAVPERLDPAQRDLVRSISTALEDSLVEEREERVVLAGTANLARVGPDFTMSLGPVLEALEEHVVLLKLLGTVAEEGGSIAVRIGHENPYAGLQTTSMVTSGYGAGSDLVAGLGVVGPTRMDYPTTMASVRAVATYVSRILAE